MSGAGKLLFAARMFSRETRESRARVLERSGTRRKRRKTGEEKGKKKEYILRVYVRLVNSSDFPAGTRVLLLFWSTIISDLNDARLTGFFSPFLFLLFFSFRFTRRDVAHRCSPGDGRRRTETCTPRALAFPRSRNRRPRARRDECRRHDVPSAQVTSHARD